MGNDDVPVLRCKNIHSNSIKKQDNITFFGIFQFRGRPINNIIDIDIPNQFARAIERINIKGKYGKIEFFFIIHQ